MRVLHVNTAPDGGAGLAARRLHRALRKTGVDSRLCFQSPAPDKPESFAFRPRQTFTLAQRIRLRIAAAIPGWRAEAVLRDVDPLRFYPKRNQTVWWSNNHFTNDLPERLLQERPDLIHLHWIGDQFFPINALHSLGLPVVWTLHDMWGFTGGCHYAGDCRKFTKACGECPVLGPASGGPAVGENDLSRQLWKLKHRSWKRATFNIISPSQWLAKEARASSLFQHRNIEVLPNCLDTDLFAPGDRAAARRKLGLPGNAVVLLFGAVRARSDLRKGYDLLIEALRKLPALAPSKKFVLLAFGDEGGPKDSLPFETRFTGTVNDESRLPEIYQASDIFILPSREDNLPNTSLEATACGLPIVGFRIGGLPDVIEHGKTGLLVKPFDTQALAEAVADLSKDHAMRGKFSNAARGMALDAFSEDSIAKRHIALYTALIVAPASRR